VPGVALINAPSIYAGLYARLIQQGYQSMAHHQSAKKRIRQTERRTEVNRARVSRIRTYVKQVELAIASGDAEAAKAALHAAEPEMIKGVQAGVIHKNTACRKVSRLSYRVKVMMAL
jgi:small subunit ribosomal protein S20